MGLREGDLKDTVIKKISVDEFEPKTGESKDVVVVGYNVIDEGAGKDLYTFINNSIVEYRDVEVSPNPNPDGYYMVFVELDRNQDVYETILSLTDDVVNITGKLMWEATTHLTDNYYPLESEEFKAALITDPDKYMTKEDFEESQMMAAQQEQHNSIIEFLQQSTLDNVTIEENRITLSKGKDFATLEIQGFGDKEIMQDLGIAESALKPVDSVMRLFNSMLGEMRALQIDESIVIFHPQQHTVLVTKLC